jgi:hypothetical protein
VHTADRVLELPDFDEQQPMTARRVDDHALLISGLVRVAGQVRVVEELLPPFRELERIEAVDRGVRDAKAHISTLRSAQRRLTRAASRATAQALEHVQIERLARLLVSLPPGTARRHLPPGFTDS